MSLLRATAQNKTNKLVAFTTSAKIYTAAELSTAFSAATLHDGDMYTFATRAAITTALGSGAGKLTNGSVGSALVVGESLKDLGTNVWVGAGALGAGYDESRMIHFRGVQRNSAAALDDGQGLTGYVAVEVNLDNAESGTFLCGVARV